MTDLALTELSFCLISCKASIACQSTACCGCRCRTGKSAGTYDMRAGHLDCFRERQGCTSFLFRSRLMRVIFLDLVSSSRRAMA